MAQFRLRASRLGTTSAVMPVISHREALDQAMREEMAREGRGSLLGGQAGRYDGACEAPQGLPDERGPWRVVEARRQVPYRA